MAAPIEPEDAVRIFASNSDGGFGSTHIKDSALIASWAQVAPAILRQLNMADMATLLANAPATRAQLHNAINKCDPALAHTLADIKHDTTLHPRQQKKLTAILRKHDQVQCTNAMNAEDMSIFLSTGGTGTGSWLDPSIDDIALLSDIHFAIASNMRLNKPLTNDLTHCQRQTDQRKCNCRTNRQLHHALQCPFGPDRNRRHNAIRDTLSKIICKITGQEPLKAKFVITVAPQTPPNHPDDNTPTSNRADITWQTATGPVHLDVMVTSAFTHAALADTTTSSVTPGFSASQTESYKKSKYSPHKVILIVFEAHGRVGDDTHFPHQAGGPPA